MEDWEREYCDYLESGHSNANLTDTTRVPEPSGLSSVNRLAGKIALYKAGRSLAKMDRAVARASGDTPHEVAMKAWDTFNQGNPNIAEALLDIADASIDTI